MSAPLPTPGEVEEMRVRHAEQPAFPFDPRWPDRWCRWCVIVGVEHVNQEHRAVYKHKHWGDAPCSRPWTALCQTQHGALCHVSDHESQPGATRALDEHVRRGDHIRSGDEDRETQTECRRAANGEAT